MSVRVNDVLLPLDKALGLDGLHRVVFVDVKFGGLALMRLSKPWRMPVVRSLALVSDCFNAKQPTLELATYQLPPYLLRPEEELPPSARDVRDEAWTAIRPLVEGPSSHWIYDVELRGGLIAQRAAELEKPPKTLHRILFRYWAYGLTENAVLPNWAARGGAGKMRLGKASGDSEGGRIGRPPKPATVSARGVVVPFNTQAEHLKVFRQAMDLFYEEEQGCKRAVYGRMTRELFISGYGERDGVVVPIPLPANEVPTFRMFDYAVKRDFDEDALLKRRIGQRNYLQNRRALNDSGRERVLGPGDRYQIDATVADVYLVNRFRRDWLIGRPIVYLVIDLFSTMITGLFVGLWGPSWDCSRLALMNAFSSKVDYCRRYGIEIAEADWPCDLTPNKLLADRQELLTNAAAGLRRNLKIHCEITPPYRPDLKFIETRFRLLNIDSRIEWLPGAATQRAMERGQRDYRLDAVLDLHQFTRILIKAIIHYNKFHFCPQLKLTHPALVRSDFDATPLNFWNWGLANGLGSLRRVDRNLLRFGLLPTDRAVIAEDGIHFKGLRYESDRALAEKWFAKARSGGRGAVEVAYDNAWNNEIWLRDARTGQFETAQLRSIDELYRNSRLEECLDLLEMNAVEPARLVDGTRASGAAVDAFIASEVKKAERLAALHPRSVSATASLANIRESRAFEAKIEQAVTARANYSAEHAEPALAPTPQSGSEVDDAAQRDVIEMLRRTRDSRRAE